MMILASILLASNTGVSEPDPSAGHKKGITGSWGDQGDGTFRNPILNADYPDVDIERLGDTYYMITSTVHYAPGMTILESRDLVNWRIIGHMWDRLSWEPVYNWDRMAGYRWGVWASDLARHDKQWFCYMIDFKSGLYVSTAEKITGPWSEPKCMLKKKHWTDPAVLRDTKTKDAYLISNFGHDANEQGPKANSIRLFRMSWDGLKLLDKGQEVYRAPGAEAAKMYKINGTYYIFLAEWRQGDRKQIVLRSDKSIYGPYERKVLLEKGAGVHRSVCQGALVRAPDDSWWYTHQLVQTRGKARGDLAGPTTGESYEGRSQWLVPVNWTDGWPLLGKDLTGNGIGNTVQQARMPINTFPVTAPQTDDEFDKAELGHQWQWNHNPRNTHWSLTERPGWLRLKAGTPIDKGGFWNAANTLSQRIMGKKKGQAVAKFDISGMKPGQQAGFCHHSGQFALLGIHVRDDGSKHLLFNNNGKKLHGPEINKTIIYFQTDITGDTASFSYSLDNHTWNRFGSEFKLKFGRWRGDRLGFYCWNDLKEAGHLDVDWFHYTYDGPKKP